MLGASSRIRHYAYVPHLAKRGIDVTGQHLIDDESLKRFYSGRSRHWPAIAGAYAERLRLMSNLRHFDLVWIEKEALPALPFAAERAIFSKQGLATVLDFDDYWMRRHEPKGLRRIATGLEAAKLRSAARAATVITASNAHLADALRRDTGREPRVIENHIDIDVYRRASEKVAAARPSSALPRIGWIGTPYTANLYLPAVAGTLNALSAEGLCEIVLIGAGDAVPEITATRLGWTLEGEADAVASIDIGIQPLRKDAFGSRKSGWKAFQYMAAGKPVISTDVASMAALIDDGVTGILVGAAAEFDAQLRMLLADRALRERMGRNGQAALAASRGIETGADKLAHLFFDAAASARAARSA